MSVPLFKTVRLERARVPNEFGETPLRYAPTVRLSNGVKAVPQQYLEVNRSLANLENILARVSVPEGYLLFAGQESNVLFIVVGIVGVENYPRDMHQAERSKIVYGRRWLIETSTPTSEVVQTAMLAIKKAREHELRERFVVRLNTAANSLHTKSRTTPFNCHQDLPLMAGARDALVSAEVSAAVSADDSSVEPSLIHQLLGSLSVDDEPLRLIEITPLGASYVLSFEVIAGRQRSQFNDLQGRPLYAVCDELSTDHVLHRILKTCLAESDRWVEEQVAFMGFARFSERVSPTALAKFSAKTRQVKVSDTRFHAEFSDMSYAVDSAKAPFLNSGELGRRQRVQLASFKNLQGHLPKQ